MFQAYKNFADFNIVLTEEWAFATADFDFNSILWSKVNTAPYAVDQTDKPLYLDDFAGNSTTTGSLSIGGSVSGRIDSSGDNDWFAIILTAGEAVRITQDAGNTNFYLVNSSGGIVGYSYSLNGSTVIDAIVSNTNTYYLRTTSSTVQNYTFSAALLTDDYTANTDTTANLSIGGTFSAAIDYRNDTDWIAIDLTAGEAVRITREVGDVAMWLLDANGHTVASAYNNSGNQVIDAVVSQTGTYYLQATSATLQNYTFSAAIIADDYTADTNTTGSLTVGGSISGSIDYRNDNDWIAIDLTAGESVRITRDSGNVNFRAVDANGNTLATSYYNSGRYVVDLDVAQSGTYYIRTYNYTTQNYSFSAAVLPDDYTSDVNTTASLVSGGTITGQIDYRNDVDWIAIDLIAGEYVQIDNTGSNYVNFSLVDANGSTVANSQYVGNGNYAVGTSISQSGTYYVQVSYSSTRSYAFSATTVVDDYAGNSSTTGSLAVGGSTNGRINYLNDNDWFAITLTAGDVIRINQDTGLTNFYLVNANGNSVSNSYNNGIENLIDYQVSQSGTYYLRVTSSAVQNYRFTATEIIDDFRSNQSTTGTLAAGDTITGNIDYRNDNDWFAVELTAGEVIHITRDSGNVNFSLLNSNGGTLVNSYIQDGGYIIDYAATQTGTYYLRVNAASERSYTFSATSISDDFSANTATTGVLADGGTIAGNIDYRNDTDWIAVELTAGEAMRITRDSGNVNFSLVNSNGSTIANSYIEGGVYVVDGIVSQSGTYYLSVQAVSEQNYSFSAAVIADDYSNDTSTTGILAVGGSISGSIDYAYDTDWIAIDLAAGDIVRVSMDVGDLGFLLVDSNGSQVAYDYTRNGILVLDYAATTDGTYYLNTGGYNNVSNYSFSAVAIADDYSADANTTGSLSVGGSVSGNIEYNNDVDWIAIDLTAGQTVRISRDSGSANFYLSAPSGAESYSYTLNGSQVLDISTQITGTYYLRVYDNNPESSYSFSAAALSDDFTADTSTTGSLVIGGTVSGSIDYRYDTDWIAIDLTAGEVVRITRDSGDSNFSLVNASGGFLSYSYSHNGSQLVDYAVSTSGTYYLRVTDFSEGSYSFSATTIADDFTGDANTTGTLAIGGTVSGSVDYRADYDWFAIDLSADKAVRITLDAGNTGLALFDADNNQVTGAYSQNGQIILDVVVGQSGTYYVQTLSFTPGNFTIRATALTDDFFASTNTTGTLSIGGTVSGTIDYRNDVDWIAVDLTAGEAVMFTLNSTDISFNLVDANGNLLSGSSSNYNLGTTSIQYAAHTTGTYYIQTASYTEQNYSIDAETITDDYVSSVATTGVLTSANPAISTYDYIGDQDWFAYTAEAGDAALFSLSFSNITGSFYSTQLSLFIYDQNGQLVGTTSQYLNLSGDVLEMGFVFDTAGTYFISSGMTSTYALGANLQISVQPGIIAGTNGADFLTGTTADDIMIGLSGNDTLRGLAGDDNIDGRSGDDTLSGGDGADYLDGGSGNDNLQGGSGNDILIGGYDADFLMGGTGADILDGGHGNDTASYLGSDAAVTVDLGAQTASGGDAAGDTFISIENLEGSAHADTLIGDDQANIIAGLDGVDTLTGGGDFDIFRFQQLTHLAGDIITDFSAGDIIEVQDMFSATGITQIFIGSDAFSGTAGEMRAAVSGVDTLVEIDMDGDGTADATLTLQGYTDGLIVAPYGSASLITDQNYINGYYGTDVIYGTSDADIIAGLGGDDFLSGLEGDDTLNGGEGNDTLVGGQGADTLFGGNGLDFTHYYGSTESVQINLATNIHTGGEAEGDMLFSIERVGGSLFDDTFIGSSEDDFFYGYAGDDSFDGGAGDDYFNGADGVDSFDGGDGIDRLSLYSTAATQAVSIDLRTGIISNDGFGNTETFVNIEGIGGGTAFADTFHGDDNDNDIYTTGTGDTANGYAGDDLIYIESAGAYDGGVGLDTLELHGGYRLVVDSDGDGFANADTTYSGMYVDLSLGQILDDGFGFSGTAINFENIIGGERGDTLIGSADDNDLRGEEGNDRIEGGAGNDIIAGGLGVDTMDGGTGNDTLSYAGETAGVTVNLATGTASGGYADGDTFINFENLHGSDGDDTLIGDTHANIITGGAGDDIINGGGGIDTFVLAGSATDYEFVTHSNGTISVIHLSDASRETDTLTNIEVIRYDTGDIVLGASLLTDGADQYSGTSGDDIIDALSGDDVLNGGAGNDRLFGAGGNDAINGGSGDDELVGGDGNDILRGSIGNDFLAGDAGNDRLEGASGNDTLYGGDGIDRLYGQGGDDLLEGGAGNDSLFGGSGNDTVYGGDGDDILTGVSGRDTLYGGLGADFLDGGGSDDVLYGGEGNDRLFGRGGADELYGEDGDDELNGGSTADLLNGGDGADTINGVGGADNILGGAGNDIINAGGGNDIVDGGADDDNILGKGGADTINGGAGNDVIDGGTASDTLFGGAGNDTLIGAGGKDRLDGGSGDDNLNGGGGNDVLTGGLGDDTMTGGSTSDRFIFADGFGNDIITDFENNRDVLDFSAHSSLNSLAAVLAVSTQVGADVVIALNATNTLTLQNFTLADLNAADFDFAGVPAEAPATDKAAVAEILEVTDKPLVSDDDSFTYVDKANVADVIVDDLNISGAQAAFAEYLAQAETTQLLYVNAENILEIGSDTDWGLSHFAGLYDFI